MDNLQNQIINQSQEDPFVYRRCNATQRQPKPHKNICHKNERLRDTWSNYACR